MTALVRMATDLLTSEIIFTVGSVVLMFCGCGGRIVTGTIPGKTEDNDSVTKSVPCVLLLSDLLC